MSDYEPVAWITKNGDGELWWHQSVDEKGNPNASDVPLYPAYAIEAQQQENERLRAERDALARDARRYQWLRGRAEVPPQSSRWIRWDVRHWNGRYWNTLYDDNLDAEIDAAMLKGNSDEHK